jgi:hypothetical protein
VLSKEQNSKAGHAVRVVVIFAASGSIDFAYEFDSRLTRRLGEHWDAHVEVRHLLTDPLTHNAPARSGTIHLSDGLAVAAGVSYRF